MRKCIICSAEASFLIKDSSDYYCEGCAKEYFSDLSLLQTVDEQAKFIKKAIEENIKVKDDAEE